MTNLENLESKLKAQIHESLPQITDIRDIEVISEKNGLIGLYIVRFEWFGTFYGNQLEDYSRESVTGHTGGGNVVNILELSDDQAILEVKINP